MIGPITLLRDGAKTLESILRPNGFRFRFRGDGKSSGGNFARAEFARRNRRIELHFRGSLGLVRYHVGNKSASHEAYMKELGVWGQCRYPGFSDDPMEAFDDLAHDLSLAEDFLKGSAVILRRAAAKEAAERASAYDRVRAAYSGDIRILDQLREHFYKKDYTEVIKLFGELRYPIQITISERKMIEIARHKIDRAGARP